MVFYGDDDLGLRKNGNTVDIFGKIGEDPGVAWGDENDTWWTADQTLVRKSSITGGFVYNPTQAYTIDPTLEWDSLPKNTFSELGKHVCDCSENTSITEYENLLRIYPNPNSSGVLNIQSSSAIKEITILNVIGQHVISKTVPGSVFNESITINPSLNGIYFMAVQLENNKRILKKIILK